MVAMVTMVEGMVMGIDPLVGCMEVLMGLQVAMVTLHSSNRLK